MVIKPVSTVGSLLPENHIILLLTIMLFAFMMMVIVMMMKGLLDGKPKCEPTTNNNKEENYMHTYLHSYIGGKEDSSNRSPPILIMLHCGWFYGILATIENILCRNYFTKKHVFHVHKFIIIIISITRWIYTE